MSLMALRGLVGSRCGGSDGSGRVVTIMQEDNGCVAGVGEEAEAFKLPLSEENVALGRLGRIYKALDRKTGRMLAVECIDVVDSGSEFEEATSPAEITWQVLAAELERCGEITSGNKGRHVFCYDSVICSQNRVYLRSTSSIVRSLVGLQKDFERLHPLVVKQYIYQVVLGLHELHKLGIFCGGLSLASLLLCGGNVIKIAAWFPSTHALNTLRTQKILVDPQFYRSSLELHLANDKMVQDVRSVAYVMVELLTGIRVHGTLMEKSNLLSKVTTGSPEWQFLSSLLALAPLKELLEHPYFHSAKPAHRMTVHDSTQEQEHIIGVLTKQELNKCQAMKRQYLQQIRAWQSQFEKKYRRKPKPGDPPAGIVRLHGRCQALNERMQELNDRLAAVHGSIYRMILDKEALTSDTSSQVIPVRHEHNLEQHKSTLDLSTGSPVGSDCSRSDSFESGGKRSPAQKAFLNRFGSPQ